ncbi:putative multiple antibiotic resistance protein [Bordetella holmesii ATCC 51541]|nr:putative multiple antibiotic resistance protein [Bordetella holmesii ATCC 51541]
MNPAKPDPAAPSNVHYRADTVTASEDNCGFLIKLVHQSLNRMLDQEMAPLDLTAMQWRPWRSSSAAAPIRPPSWHASSAWTRAR